MKRGKYERVTTSNKMKWFPLIIVVICASLVVVGCTIKNKTTDKDIESTISNNVELPIENIVEIV